MGPLKRDGQVAGEEREPRAAGADDAERAEERGDAAWLEARERGDSPLPHIDPQRAESYQRIEEAIADLPELAPPVGWDTELQAQLDALDARDASMAAEEAAAVDEAAESAAHVDGALEDRAAVAVEVPLARGSRQLPMPTPMPISMPTAAALPVSRWHRFGELGRRASASPPGSLSLWIPAAGALGMAAAVLVLAFGVLDGPTVPQGVEDGRQMAAVAARPAGGESGSAQRGSATPASQSFAQRADARPQRPDATLAAEEPPPPPRLRVVAAPGAVTRGGPDAPARGDLLTVDVSAGRGQLRLYRNRAEVARCPGSAQCGSGEGQLVVLSYPLVLPGEYRAVYYEGAGMDGPSAGLAEDQRRCRQLAEQAAGTGAAGCRWQMTVAREVK
jgi:hypothetical protein